MKAELRKRIANNSPSTHVAGLFRAFGMWVQMADYIDLPTEFMPGFTASDWQGDKQLFKEVSRYEADRITPWRDIPHDELIRLLQYAQMYAQDFSDDILFMNKKFNIELVDLVGRPDRIAFSEGKTKPIFEALVNHKFANDPRTGKPWLTLLTAKKIVFETNYLDVISSGPCRTEVSNLLESCIFLLLLWTATRVSELLHFETNGLFVNGKRLGEEENAVEIFKQATGLQGTLKPRFELEFRTFKMSKAKTGALRKIPMAPDAALAFCIVVELFKHDRNRLGNPYLFPTGVMNSGTRRDNQKTPAAVSFINWRLAKLCTKVGVESHHPHKCRKTLPTIIINKNPNSLELIQRLLGHHTPSMTLRYIMSIPSIGESVRQHLFASNQKRIVDLLMAAATRRMSGKGAERMMDAIPPEKLAAEVLPHTIQEYIDLLLADPNFVVIKAPAAWCLRFKSFRPQQMPCLPNIDLSDVPLEDIAPNPSNCRPWECGYAAHTRHHLQRARSNRNASKKNAGAAGIRAALGKSFTIQAQYWGDVVRHLEQGHDKFQEVIPAEVVNFWA